MENGPSRTCSTIGGWCYRFGDPYWYSLVGERRHKLRREVKIMDESCQPLWLSFYGDEAGKISDSVLNEGIISISKVRV